MKPTRNFALALMSGVEFMNQDTRVESNLGAVLGWGRIVDRLAGVKVHLLNRD